MKAWLFDFAVVLAACFVVLLTAKAGDYYFGAPWRNTVLLYVLYRCMCSRWKEYK